MRGTNHITVTINTIQMKNLESLGLSPLNNSELKATDGGKLPIPLIILVGAATYYLAQPIIAAYNAGYESHNCNN